MMLLDLPAEILFQIFEFVGSAYFRSSWKHLAICKEWSNYAIVACYRDFYVTPKKLARLRHIDSRYTWEGLFRIRNNAKSLEVELNEEDGDQLKILYSQGHGGGRFTRYQRRHDWAVRTDSHLSRLASVVGQSRKLRTLRILATPSSRFIYYHGESEYYDFLFPNTLKSFLLSANHLTTLDLDLSESELVYLVNAPRRLDDYHICSRIAELLTTLEKLRLRMRSICPELLRVPPHKTGLRLREVLINLSLRTHQPLMLVLLTASHACHCKHFPRTGNRLLKEDMEKQAQELVTHMAAPKMVRILSHETPASKMRAFDAMTGKYIMLGEDTECQGWDEPGEVIEKGSSN
ncbi:hypothetical protein DM02DRAFT_668576 [Periconia macrospinosa]|uniref:F-box domain-containing protein n=1 Tax=Periconia macrospinosa TaxID=97972 RepID=A0A2V1E3S2_9PLEO|nr:hypothetical protein DM02DRAFT_668576 [Periconia macrospinosa]